MLFDQDIDIPETLVTDDLKVALIEERVRYSLRVKPEDVSAFGTESGIKLPTKIGATKILKSQTVAMLGPDEWILIAEVSRGSKLSEGLAQAQESLICSVTDISHRNVGFTFAGREAANAISVGCPLDLRLACFPVGKATRTVFENAPVLLIRTGDDSFHIECWRSFGPYLRDFLAKFAGHLQSAPQ